MLRLIKNLLERNAIYIALILSALIAYLSLKTIHIENPLNLSFFDKILHFCAYFSLTLSWLFVFRRKKKKYIVIFLVFCFGIIIEFLQGSIFPNRTKDIFDVLANGFGIIFATLIFKSIYKYYKKIVVNLD